MLGTRYELALVDSAANNKDHSLLSNSVLVLTSFTNRFKRSRREIKDIFQGEFCI